MDIFWFNTQWMLYNSFLAILPVVFIWIVISVKNRLLRLLFGLAWLVFLPNTIYVLTDLIHFMPDWNSLDYFGKLILLVQYAIFESFGIVMFVLALYPVESKFTKVKKKQKEGIFFIIILNFIIGFGLVLGRVERINSWDILVDSGKASNAILHIFQTVSLLNMVIFFGFIANVSYFLLRNIIVPKAQKSFKKLL